MQPLINAAASGNLDSVLELMTLPESTDLNATDSEGKTALMHAVIGGHHDVIDSLLSDYNIDLDQSDKNGRTALSYAIMKSDMVCVKTLLGGYHTSTQEGLLKGLWDALELGQEQIFQDLLEFDAIDWVPVYSKLKMNRLKNYRFFSKKIKNAFPDISSSHKLFVAQKGMAHSWQLNCKGTLPGKMDYLDIQRDASGHKSVSWMKFMAKVSGKLSERVPQLEIELETLKDMFNYSAEIHHKDKVEITSRIKQGIPTLLPLSWKPEGGRRGHAVTILFMEGLCVFSPVRGKEIKLYQFDPLQFDINLLTEILDCKSRSDFEVLPEIVLKIGSKHPICAQMNEVCQFIPCLPMGNCSWAGPEIEILFFLILTFLKKNNQQFGLNSSLETEEVKTATVEALEVFHLWVKVARLDWIEKYLTLSLKAGKQPSWRLLEQFRQHGLKLDGLKIESAVDETKNLSTKKSFDEMRNISQFSNIPQLVDVFSKVLD